MNTLSKYTIFNFILFILLAFLWSGSFINIKIVVDSLPPVFCAMMRVLISLFCLGVLFVTTHKKVFFLPPKNWSVWVAGVFTQALPFAFLFFGEKYIAPALASILNSTVSFWALLLGTLVFRDMSQWTPVKLTGLLLGFVGLMLIFFPMIHQGENSVIGVIAVLGMAICYAIGGLINQHVIFKNKNITFEINIFQQHISSVLLLLIISLTCESWSSLSNVMNPKVVFSFLYLGVMATAIAWMIYFYLIREWGAVRAASVMYLVPVLAIVWDFVFLHNMPSHNELIGAAAILSGVILVQWVRKPKAILQPVTENACPAKKPIHCDC